MDARASSSPYEIDYIQLWGSHEPLICVLSACCCLGVWFSSEKLVTKNFKKKREAKTMLTLDKELGIFDNDPF